VLLEVILPLLLAALVVLVLALFLRRANRALVRTRELEQYREQMAAVARFVDAILGPLTDRVDAVRRNQVPAVEIQDELEAASDLLGDALRDASAVAPPPGLPPAADLVDQIERGIRALDTIRYGCSLVTEAAGRRGKELEAQTSIKRGYLNLLHAREAVAEEAGRARAAAAEIAPRRRWRTSRA